MRLSAVTDEISKDFVRAVQLCREWKLRTVELRVINGTNIVFQSKDEILRIKRILQQEGLQVCGIASPFLKSQLWHTLPEGEAEAAQKREWEILERSFEVATLLGAPLVRTFSFLRVADVEAARPHVLATIAEAVRRTQVAGLKLMLENEHACMIATGAETGWLLEQIPSKSFGITWDPGNAAALGDVPFPDGYQHVRGRIFNVHLKDVGLQHRWVKLGTGSIDYVGQLQALAADGYDGTLGLEPHYAHPEGGLERAGWESLLALQAMLRQAEIPFE